MAWGPRSQSTRRRRNPTAAHASGGTYIARAAPPSRIPSGIAGPAPSCLSGCAVAVGGTGFAPSRRLHEKATARNTPGGRMCSGRCDVTGDRDGTNPGHANRPGSAPAQAQTPADALGRDTPRGAVTGFWLRAARGILNGPCLPRYDAEGCTSDRPGQSAVPRARRPASGAYQRDQRRAGRVARQSAATQPGSRRHHRQRFWRRRRDRGAGLTRQQLRLVVLARDARRRPSCTRRSRTAGASASCPGFSPPRVREGSACSSGSS